MLKAKYQRTLSVSLPTAVYDKIKEISNREEVSMGEVARKQLGKIMRDERSDSHETE
jgi:hypothetical protein